MTKNPGGALFVALSAAAVALLLENDSRAAAITGLTGVITVDNVDGAGVPPGDGTAEQLLFDTTGTGTVVSIGGFSVNLATEQYVVPGLVPGVDSTDTTVEADGDLNSRNAVAGGGNSRQQAWARFGGPLIQDSNGADPNFVFFEANGNDDASFAPILATTGPIAYDGGTRAITGVTLGQFVSIAVGGSGDFGDTGLDTTDQEVAGDGGNAGNNITGFGFSITELLDAGGNPLTADDRILGVVIDFAGFDPIEVLATGITITPEPSSAILCVVASTGLCVVRRRFK